MRRFLFILLLLTCGSLCAQSPTIVVHGEELASGVYSHDFIDVFCTVPSSLGIVAYVNGQKQNGSSEKGARPGTRRVRISNLPELEYEKCRIRLEFTDRSGRVIDVKEFELNYKDPRKNLYMLSVGVGGSLQDGAFPPLTFPKYDATNIRDCFRDYTKSYYIEKSFQLLCDRTEITTSSIRSKLNQIANDIQGGEVFMLYLSGHGEEKDGEFYFITYDTRKSDLRNTALSGLEIRKYLHRMASKQATVFVFMDACHSEALYLKDENPSDGIVYYASCLADEMSSESPVWKNSVYASALISAMQGTDGGAQVGDGNITVASLQDYLYSRVRRETGFDQNPVCYHPGFGDKEIIFKSPVKKDSPRVQSAVSGSESVPQPATDAVSAYQEALKYQSGNGVAKDLSRAFRLMKQAAESGYTQAYRPLADMYHGGRGVQKDRSKAEYWYQKAVDAGDKEAWRILISM